MSDELDAIIGEHQAAAKAPAADDLDALIGGHQAEVRQAPAQGSPEWRRAILTQANAKLAGDRDAGNSILRAAVNGATLHRAPELLKKLDPTNADAYRQEYAQASADHPVMDFAGGMAVPVPGVGPLKALKGATGVAARLLTRAGVGAGLGLATGGTDLSPAKRALIGGGAGLVGGGIAEGLAPLGAAVANRFRGAWADQAALESKAAQKALASTRGSLGGQSSAVFNDVAKAQEIVSKPEIYGTERVARAQEYLQSPEAKEVLLNAADNLLESGPARLREQLQTARNAFETAKSAATPEAIDAATTAKMEHPIREQVLPRVKHILNRTVPIAIAHAIGGGAPTEMAAAAAMGHPGTTLSNMMKSPAVRALFYGNVQKVLPRAEAAVSKDSAPLIERLERGFSPAPAYAQSPQDARTLAIIDALKNSRGEDK